MPKKLTAQGINLSPEETKKYYDFLCGIQEASHNLLRELVNKSRDDQYQMPESYWRWLILEFGFRFPRDGAIDQETKQIILAMTSGDGDNIVITNPLG